MFINLLNNTKLKMANRKLFVPNGFSKKDDSGFMVLAPAKTLHTMPYQPKTNQSANPSFKAQLMNATAREVSKQLPGIVNAAGNAAAAQIGNYLNKGGNNNNNNNNNKQQKPANKSPGLAVFKGCPIIGENNVNYALSKAPNPKAISLNSGIRPNAYSNDAMPPVENFCSPMHISGIKLGIPTNATNPLSSYFTNTICFDIQTRAQANVGFNLDITTKLSTSQLVTAFNAAINALQVYFWYSSIMSYESNSRNKNAGMIFLRKTIDSQMMSDISQLGRRLEDVAIPPRVVEWVRYMNGNFLSSDSSGSPLIKIVREQSQLKMGYNNLAASALSALASDANNTVFSLLRNTIPKWRIGVLYDCPTMPTFDRQYLSIFANLPTVNLPASTFVIGNSAPNNITAAPYNSYANNLDGVAFSMGGIFNTTTNEYIPGLTVNSGSDALNRDTRLSYYSIGDVKAFWNVYSVPFLSASRQETTSFNNTVVLQPHLFGTDKIQNVTGEALLQSAQSTLDFLFDTDSIPIKGKISHFNRGSKMVGRI